MIFRKVVKNPFNYIINYIIKKKTHYSCIVDYSQKARSLLSDVMLTSSPICVSLSFDKTMFSVKPKLFSAIAQD